MSVSATKPLRLGLIGMSEGNGHPFSWAAIINGYDAEAMRLCPFPAIPQYLAERCYPDEFISGAQVTHLWTQDVALSQQIAQASLIPNIVNRPEAMVGKVDAVLLARDDALNHRRFAEPFLHAGVPIYIDKPLALSRRGADALMRMAASDRHLFSCSALRYAVELLPTTEHLAQIGTIRVIDAWSPKCWDTYAIHMIEPVLVNFGRARKPLSSHREEISGITVLRILSEDGTILRFTSGGSAAMPIGFRVSGDSGYLDFVFRDSFSCFKAALSHFIGVIRGEMPNIAREDTLTVIDILELGRRV